jgi:hypothetical protein
MPKRTMDQQRAAIRQILHEMKADAAEQGALPNWMEDLVFFGDLRLRYEWFKFSGSDDPAGSTARNRRNRARAQFRLRFGIKKYFLDKQMEVGFRLVTGEPYTAWGADPTVPDQTMTGGFTNKRIWVDRAYAKFTPKQWGRWLEGLTVIGGKFAVPFVHTDLVWDEDVNPEGVAAMYEMPCGNFTPFAGIAWLSVHEFAQAESVYVVAYQAGTHVDITEDVRLTSAAALYDYDNWDRGVAAGSVRLGGNTAAANEFLVLNVTNKVCWKMFDLPMSAYFDWVYNCQEEVTAAPFDRDDCGYALGFKVGENKKAGDWSASYKFAYIQANCTPGFMNDADFGMNFADAIRGTNRKGHVLRAAYNLTDFLTVGGAFFCTKPVDGVDEGQKMCRVQGDLVWKF